MPTQRDRQTQAIIADATEFGLHMKQGGWRLGLLVARNVAIAPGRVAPETLLPKVNATEFARRAGTSNDRVIRHYAAWERAAKAGLVPRASELTPGTDIDIDVDHLPAWGPIYNAPIERRTPPARHVERAPAPVTTRTADPVTPPTAPLDAAPDPGDAQISAALEAARVRLAYAREEIRDPEYDAEAAATARDIEWSDDVRYAINAVIGHTRRLVDAVREPEWVNPRQREQAAEDMARLSRQFALLAEIATDPAKASMTDAALTALINS